MGRPKVSIEERFWNKVKKTDTCWLWLGYLDKDGYGAIYTSRPNRKLLKAHRVSYELHKGAINDGMAICHSCDNPTCVNPEHLWQGTIKDNTTDAFKKGRRTLDHRNALGQFHKR